MPGNTGEQHPDIGASIPPEANSDKSNSINTSQPVTTHQETDSMEVHAHDLHKAPGHGVKHYLFEFLMLFLAVFCGFLAENLREHMVEQRREKEYARHLLADLRADSIFFAKRAEKMNQVLTAHQAFYQLMTGPSKASNKDILTHLLPIFYIYDLQTTPATYNQMKTSGSLRYIQDESLVNLMQKYYEVRLPRAELGVAVTREFFNNFMQPFLQKHFRVQDYDIVSVTLKTDSPVFLDRNESSEQELLNMFETYGRQIKVVQDRIVIPTMAILHELMSMLKKEYHLQ
ncbi:MAG: hypothetical protein ABUT20_27070 [Bacteroidota bacterium]